MSVAVVMPQLGLTMEEGTLSAWLKKTGDTVKKNDLLFSVSTDKVEMDVESVADGVLGEIIEPAGKTVPVGTVVAYIKVAPGSDETPSAQPPAPAVEKSAPPETSAAPFTPKLDAGDNSKGAGKGEAQKRVSPRAKRLAKELGVDLARVGGNNGGEVAEKDIRAASEHMDKTSNRDAARAQLIAERLTRSVRTIPAFSVAAEVNAENLVGLYESLKAPLKDAAGVSLTISDLLLNIFARSLRANPAINATWEKNGIRRRTSVDIGLAVATSKGLLVPVIRDADRIDLQTLAARRSKLVDKARQGRLLLTDLEGCVTTLSNLGMYRVDQFQAIIDPAQSSILAVGQIRRRPWADKTLTIQRTFVLNLTLDHRVADGAAAAVFLGKMIELIEDPGDLTRKAASFAGEAHRRANG